MGAGYPSVITQYTCTYSLLCSPLVRFDLQLQFVYQVLQTGQILPVLFSLHGVE